MTDAHDTQPGRDSGRGESAADRATSLERELDAMRLERDEAWRDLAATRHAWARQRDRFERLMEQSDELVAKGIVARQRLGRIRHHPVVRLGRLLSRTVASVRRTAGIVSWQAGEATTRSSDPGRSSGGLTIHPRASLAAERRVGAAILASLPPEPSAAMRPLTVVVDPAGDPTRTAATLAWLRRQRWPQMEVSVSRPGETLIEAQREVLAGTTVGLVLFVSTVVEPLEDGWLARLIDGLDITQAGVAGPRFIYGRRPAYTQGTRVAAVPDLALSSRGLSVDLEDGVPVTCTLGSGEEPGLLETGETRQVRALSGACFLVRSDALAAIGGVRPEELAQPLDLFVRLRAAGWSAAYVGSSVFWDRSPERPSAGRHSTEATADRGLSPSSSVAFRPVFIDALSAGGLWMDRPLDISVVTVGDEGSSEPDRAVARALADGLHAVGFRVTRLDVGQGEAPSWPLSIDVAIIVSAGLSRRQIPRNTISVALIGNAVDRWLGDVAFDDHDVVIVEDPRLATEVRNGSSKDPLVAPDLFDTPSTAAFVRDALLTWARAPKVAIHIGPKTWEAAASWGDTPFARALQKQFERRGWPSTLLVFADRDIAAAQRADVAIHVFGARAPQVRPGQLTFLWVISHPDRVTARMCEPYDIVFVASDSYARQLSDRIGPPVVPLHQATDPERFFSDPHGPHHELLFVGNSRKMRRQILDDLSATKHDFAVYGQNWTPDLLDPQYLQGEWIPNAELRRYYSSANIVLCDHYEDMRDEGFISNRAYDALACGAFVVSDHVPGLDEEFDGGAVSYTDAEDLESIIDHFLDYPEERLARAECGRAAVLERHTFASRVDAIIAEASPRLDRTGARSHADA